jgi:acetyl esterase
VSGAYHPQVAALLAPGAVFDPARSGGPPDLDLARADYATTADRLGGNPVEVAYVTDLEIARASGDGAVPVRIFHPLVLADGPPGAIVWAHGGGWAIGDLAGIDRVCRALCAASGHIVLAVDYRLAPEHPYPAGLDDVWTVVQGAATAPGCASLGLEPGHVVVGGDSAGGNLAAAAALRARDAGVRLAGQLLVYPALDPRGETPASTEHADDPLLGAADMRTFWAVYAGGDADAHAQDPEFAPLRATDLTGIAPAHVAVAEIDPLRDDGLLYAEALERAGVRASTRTHAGMGHGFLRWGGVVDEASVLIDELAAAATGFLAG